MITLKPPAPRLRWAAKAPGLYEATYEGHTIRLYTNCSCHAAGCLRWTTTCTGPDGREVYRYESIADRLPAAKRIATGIADDYVTEEK